MKRGSPAAGRRRSAESGRFVLQHDRPRFPKEATMATKQRNKKDSARIDDGLPGEWKNINEDELGYGVVDAFRHQDTGLRVTIESQRRPTQMHDPMTAREDSGYVARVRGHVGADLCHELSARRVALEAAADFIEAHPDGQFDVPMISEQPHHGPIDWRDN